MAKFVPYLSDEQIECDAGALLAEYARRRGVTNRPTRHDDVLAFYGDSAAAPPLAFSATIKDMKAMLYNA